MTYLRRPGWFLASWTNFRRLGAPHTALLRFWKELPLKKPRAEGGKRGLPKDNAARGNGPMGGLRSKWFQTW